MAYGRLDVFWPDGKFESFLLDSPSVSVGRSSGCTVVLDTETISRYHFSITNENDQIHINDLDSANGTFVDGQRLDGNEARPLHGGEEFQVGHLRMIFHLLDEQATVPMDEVAEDTQRFVKEDFGFSMEVYGPEIAVPPGSHTSIEISINNRHEEARRFTVKVSGMPEGWARVNRPQLVVEPDDGAPVLVNIKPLRQSDSKPGEYNVKIEVALKDEPEKKLEAEIPVTILPYSGFGMAMAARRITAYESFRLHVHNQGSIGLPIYVMGRSKDDSLRFDISDPQVLLAPGERYIVQGEVKPRRRRLFGAPKETSFDIMVRSRDEAAFLAAVRAYYRDQPILPTWAAVLLLGAAVMVFVLLLASLVILLQSSTPEPQITGFSAARTLVPQGESIMLSWIASDAENITMLVNNDPINTEIPADSSTFALDTSAYSGQIEIVARAENGENVAQQSILVTVYEPLSVDYFEVIPEILVRHVVQDLNVRWNVSQATTTRVEGLDSLGPVSLEPSYGSQGDFVVSGIPSNNFAVTLYAEDVYGNTLEEVRNIDLISPECVTPAELTLYAAPDETANVISTLPQDTTLVVDGRDDTGAWLRTTQLPGGVEAWGARTGMQCDDIFNPDALQIRIPQGEILITPTPVN